MKNKYSKPRRYIYSILTLSMILVLSIITWSCQNTTTTEKTDDTWTEDFNRQSISNRPPLEVRYSNATRESFDIIAETYQLTGQLTSPHQLISATDQKVWLSIDLTDSLGKVYTTEFTPEPSRINLYRRGPYYCEIHWLDIQVTTKDGKKAPLKGDLTLFCYPDKILAEINWYSLEDFSAFSMSINGIAPARFTSKALGKGEKKSFSFPLFGETPPLADTAFTLLVGDSFPRYDKRRGCYVVGTSTSPSFQKQFYEFPNRYETASFNITNDSLPRKIYICHESVVGGGIVEGGILLDEEGHPLPVLVQVSKNFAGEKEEKFYNPLDTAFSETYFPLYLEPNESLQISSLHLYQNWGRHMTKHWSSLGAWMDYFHSSTGVTETTCYVPFKFGGLGGVSIADFRAMSQEAFWKDQPQHDNLAGHSFLSFFDGTRWQHAVYQGTVYRNTGPNWFDIGLKYLSADSSIGVTADIFETPQADELRSFFRVTYEVLKPLTIEDAGANFRFLSITSAIQKLKFTRVAATGLEEKEISAEDSPFPVKGHPLPSTNAFLAEYGDSRVNRGSNAIIIRSFKGPRGIGPAVSFQLGSYNGVFGGDDGEDTRLLLVPDKESITLSPGDRFEIEGYWLPYGDINSTATPREEVERYGHRSPRVVDVKMGTVLNPFPATLKAEGNEAIFSIEGGKGLLPVVVTGLTEWKNPAIFIKENDAWQPLSHHRNTKYDGNQVFSEGGGTFGAVFLVHSNEEKISLKVTVGIPLPDMKKLVLSVADHNPSTVSFRSANNNIEGLLTFPGPEPRQPFSWQNSEANSLWFEQKEEGWIRGGRITPNEEDIDIEYWWQNKDEDMNMPDQEFTLDVSGSKYFDGEQPYILRAGGWEKLTGSASHSEAAIAWVSADKKFITAMAWTNAEIAFTDENNRGSIRLTSKAFPADKRFFVRGKVYHFEGNLEQLAGRIRREMF